MFGLSIVKTADLNNLKLRVADLEQDLDLTLDRIHALHSKYDSLVDQVQRSDKATREQLSALAKPNTGAVLQQPPKHVTDPVGAWESKQRALEARLKTAVADVGLYERKDRLWSGLSNGSACLYGGLKRMAQEQVEQLKKDIYEHQKRKPTVVQKAPESETAVVVRHKQYGTLGLLKCNHITILSKSELLDVGDVILNATPEVVHKFWDTLPQFDTFTFVL